MIRLLSAQAKIASIRKKRARLPALSFLSGPGEPRRDGLERIRSAVWRGAAARQAGVAFAGSAIMCRRMAERPQAGATKTLKELFEKEPDRLSRFSFEAAGIYFDWSKTHLDADVMEESLTRAERMGFLAAREALFGGAIVNPSEGRPATHVAERGSGAPDVVDLATARRQRMRALVDAIEGGAFGAVTGILHIGIGGSVLGPALLVDSLGRRSSNLTVRFLSNIDGAAFDDAVRALDPATTLVVAASKTFSTLETLANLDSARAWLRDGGMADPDARVIAVTAKPDAAIEQGIDETRILQFGEGVGGRY